MRRRGTLSKVAGLIARIVEPIFSFRRSARRTSARSSILMYRITLRPEYVWLGFNSRPKSMTLPEPSEVKVKALLTELAGKDVEVRGKDLRGIEI